MFCSIRFADENVKYGWIYSGRKIARIIYYLYSTSSNIICNLFENFQRDRYFFFLSFFVYSSYFYPRNTGYRIFDITFEIFIYTCCSILMILLDSFILHGYCLISFDSPFGFFMNYLIIPIAFIIFILLLINFYLSFFVFVFSISVCFTDII